MSTFLHHRGAVTLDRRETRFGDGCGASPKGDGPSGAQVWVIRTALAEPKFVTLPWRSRRTRRPPGRHIVRQDRRERSGALPIPQEEAGGSDEGVTVLPEGARAAAEAKTRRQWSSDPGPARTVLSCKGTPCNRVQGPQGVWREFGRPAHRTRKAPATVDRFEPSERTEPVLLECGAPVDPGVLGHSAGWSEPERTWHSRYHPTWNSAGIAVLPSVAVQPSIIGHVNSGLTREGDVKGDVGSVGTPPCW